jgi:hypothetical protein
MLDGLALVLLLTAAWPLWLAWQGNARTSLAHAIAWAALAWTAWVWLTAEALLRGEGRTLDLGRYLALSLTGCAGVAVLGARRPGVGAWNFVLAGLLAVMLLPLAERLIAGAQPLDPVRAVFLGATVALAVLNYLPTRLGPAAVLFGLGGGWELAALLDPGWLGWSAGRNSPGRVCVALTPLLAWYCWRRGLRTGTPADELWLSFRDRYGLLWSQRVREQMNRSAANAGWSVRLYWQGFVRTALAGADPGETQEEVLKTLRVLLKRFIPSDGDEAGVPPSGGAQL